VCAYEVAMTDLREGRLDRAEAGFLRYGYSPQEVALLLGDHLLQTATTVGDYARAANHLQQAEVARDAILTAVAEHSLSRAIRAERRDFEAAMAKALVESGFDPRPVRLRLHQEWATELYQLAMQRDAACRNALGVWKTLPCPTTNVQDLTRAHALQRCAREVADLSNRSLEQFRQAEVAAPRVLEQNSSSWQSIEAAVSSAPCPSDTSKVVAP
jgi:hypothetical protein